MIWHRREDERYYRWRRRFALFPRKVGPYRIWLEPYTWRNCRPHECPPAKPFEIMFNEFRWHEEWQLRSGYTVRCKVSRYVSLAHSFTTRTWYVISADREMVPA